MIVYIVNGVIGSIIGFFTNWLAIKMLLKPLKPVYVGKYRVPFTPGIIPKEKERLAEKIGSTVGSKLLTAEVVEKAFRDKEMTFAMDAIFENVLVRLSENPLRIRDVLYMTVKDGANADTIFEEYATRHLTTALQSGAFTDMLTDFLHKKLIEFGNMSIHQLEESIHISKWMDKGTVFLQEYIKREALMEKLSVQLMHFIDKESMNTQSLSGVLPMQFFESAKTMVFNHSDKISAMVIKVFSHPQIEQNILAMMDGMLNSNMAMKMLSAFVTKETVYQRIKQELENYLGSDKGQAQLANAIGHNIDHLKEMQVDEVLKKINRKDLERFVGGIVQFATKEELVNKFLQSIAGQGKKYLLEHPDMTVQSVLEPIIKGEISYQKWVEDVVSFVVENYSTKVAKETVRRILPLALDQKVSVFATLIRKYKDHLGGSISEVLFPWIQPRLGDIIQALNIPKMVADKVNEYDIAELESIILSVVDRELKAVVMLGALFGFLIGLAGPLISSFLV